MLEAKKKVSAAAVAAVLSLPAIALAGPVLLPYYTNFSTTPDSNGDTYSNGALQGQGHNNGADNSSTGWVNENGEQNDSATVAGVASGNGTVTLTSTLDGGTTAAPIWSDVYNSNLADHPLGLYGSSNGNGSNLVYSSNKLAISYNLDVLGTGSLGSNGTAASAFGMRVLDASDNLLAALFVKGDPSVPGQENVYVQTGTGSAQVTGLTGPANGTTGHYSIALDLQHQDFQVFVNGFASADIPFGPGLVSPDTSIGGITFATDNLGGGNQGVFSSLSVVPEPASFVIIGLGGLLLLAKRPKRAEVPV
jgi:hypothetical protein